MQLVNAVNEYNSCHCVYHWSDRYSTMTWATEWSDWQKTMCQWNSRRKLRYWSTSVNTWTSISYTVPTSTPANGRQLLAMARHQCRRPASSWRNGFVPTERSWCTSAMERCRSYNHDNNNNVRQCVFCVFVSYCIYVVLLWARWGGPDGIET